MKNKALKAISAAVAFCLVGTAAVFIFSAQGENKALTNTAEKASISDVIDTKTPDTDETVYIVANADGSPKKIIVSDVIQNADNTMQTRENDDLPVSMKITYTLDGNAISAADLAGKSGKVKIRFDYINNESKTVNVNGEDEKIYVPFAMLTGLMLDNDKFDGVSVTNGKVINDGDRTFVVGLAMPGMQENLGVDKSDMEIPSYVEIEANTTGFSLTTSVTFATNDLFNHFNFEDVTTADDLKASLSDLSDATQSLIDGSSQLYDGISLLLSKSSELISGVKQLADGSKTLYDSTSTLLNGAQEISTNMDTLNGGLSQLSQNSSTLNGGARQIFETLLSTAQTQLKQSGIDAAKLTPENYKTVLNKVISSLDKDAVYKIAYNTAKQTVTQEVNSKKDYITVQVTEGFKKQILAGALAQAGITAEQYESGQLPAEVVAQIDGTVSAMLASGDIQAQITATVAAKIDELIEQNMASDEVTQKINEAVAQAQAGKGSIQALIKQLDSYNDFYTGLLQYTAGVDKAASGSALLANGAKELSNGAKKLNSGAYTLYTGIVKLSDGSGSLYDGVAQLKDGAMQLSDGMKKFNDEGISKLVKTGNDVEKLVNRLKATADVSKEYQSLDKLGGGTTGSVKFIYRTETIDSKSK